MKLKYWMWLVLVMGAGNPKIWNVIKAAGTPEDGYELLKDEQERKRLGLTVYQERNASRCTLEQAEEMIALCEKKNISITHYDADDYPELLRKISNPPVVLFYQGDIGVLTDNAVITVVGARKPSEYSVRVTDWICRDLSRAGFVIVSGFAVGIDSAAHRAALLSKGKTAAVLGCGIDVDYPKGNADGKKHIIKNGVLLTEFLPGTEPLPKNFPLRNRILSGVSLGTIVAEASGRSGALVTASLAQEQGKNVFCIPPADLFDNRYAGVVKYLRDGAVPVFSYLDIVNEYYAAYAHRLNSSVLFELSHNADDSAVFPEGSKDKAKSSSDKQSGKKSAEEKAPKQTEKDKENAAEEHEEEAAQGGFRDFACLDGMELRIAQLLAQEHRMHIDEILDRLDADVDEVASALTELAVMGYVARTFGQHYEIL